MKEETTITFLAAECGEFHGMGECIECTSLKEAFRHYQRFCKRSPQMLPSLEFSLHHAEDPLYNEGEYPLATGEKGKELLSYVPYYANHPLVQEAVRELEQLESQQKKFKKAGKGTLESTEDGRCVIERYQRKSAGSKSKDPQSCLPASERTGAFCDAGDKRKDQHHGR